VAAPAGTHPPSGGLLSGAPTPLRYGVATVAMAAGVLSQYLPGYPVISTFWMAEVFSGLTTYGPGLAAFFLLIGTQPLRNAARRMSKATLEGLRWYGILGVASFLTVILLTILYSAFVPNLDHILSRNTPVDTTGAADPWLWIALSFLIGLIEETLFRGFLFGAALMLFGTRRWRVHAVWTSSLFTGLHLYYGQTYGAESPLYYVQIFFLGLAFCYAYFYSGGNLLIVALLHGLFDAISFSQFLPHVGLDGAAGLRYGLLGVACLVALALYLRERGQSAQGQPLPPFAGPMAGPAGALSMPALIATGAGPSAVPPSNSPGSMPPVLPSAASSPPWPVPLPASSGGPPSTVPAPSAAFVPAYCPVCGAIIMGDVRGIPSRCPRCGQPVGGPPPLPPPGPASVGGVPPMVQGTVMADPRLHGPSWPTPGGGPSSAGSAPPAEPFEDLLPGAWPPLPPLDPSLHHFSPSGLKAHEAQRPPEGKDPP
jgi:membrane protease YdiL (CAAX protease family)